MLTWRATDLLHSWRAFPDFPVKSKSLKKIQARADRLAQESKGPVRKRAEDLQSAAAKLANAEEKRRLVVKKKHDKPEDAKAPESLSKLADMIKSHPEIAINLYEAFADAFKHSVPRPKLSHEDVGIAKRVVTVNQKFMTTIAAGFDAFFFPTPMSPTQLGFYVAVPVGATLNSWFAGHPGANETWDGMSYAIPAGSFLNKVDYATVGGVKQTPEALVGGTPERTCCALVAGRASLRVLVPFSATANIGCMGPSDARNLQGIGSGVFNFQEGATIGLTAAQGSVKQRPYYLESAQFFSSNSVNTITANCPVQAMLVGASSSAERVMSYALNPCKMFCPRDYPSSAALAAYQAMPASSLSRYPADSCFAGPLAGNGAFLISSINGGCSVEFDLTYHFSVEVDRSIQPLLGPNDSSLSEGHDRFPTGEDSYCAAIAPTMHMAVAESGVRAAGNQLASVPGIADKIPHLASAAVSVSSRASRGTSQIVPMAEVSEEHKPVMQAVATGGLAGGVMDSIGHALSGVLGAVNSAAGKKLLAKAGDMMGADTSAGSTFGDLFGQGGLSELAGAFI